MKRRRTETRNVRDPRDHHGGWGDDTTSGGSEATDDGTDSTDATGSTGSTDGAGTSDNTGTTGGDGTCAAQTAWATRGEVCDEGLRAVHGRTTSA